MSTSIQLLLRKMFCAGVVLLAIVLVGSTAQAQVNVDLTTWSQQGPAGNGDWNVASDGSSVTQEINGNPTFFVSPTTFSNTTIEGTFQVATTSDDDYIGFVFGYQSPNATSGSGANDFQFFLFDWKQRDQSFGGGQADRGFVLSKVDGNFSTFNGSEPFWHHDADETGFDILAAWNTQQVVNVPNPSTQTTSNARGWQDNAEYEFELLYQTNRIRIVISSTDDSRFAGGTTIFDVTPSDVGLTSFPEGRFGFYNYSQDPVVYQGFTLNNAPTANDDNATTDAGNAVAIDVLANDTDPDPQTLSVTGFTSPSNGSVTGDGSGTLTYTPDAGFVGTDTFTYTVSDGAGGTDDATVTINVTNNPPTATADNATTDEGVAIDIPVLDNDSDPDPGQVLSVGSITSPPSNGSVTVNSDGTIRYTPDPAFTGQDTFEYEVSDGEGGTDTALVTVDVMPQPTCDGVPTLAGPDQVDASNRTVSNTMLDNDGIQTFTFSTLVNFPTVTIDPASAYTRSGDTWTFNGTGAPPTSVDFTLTAGPSGEATYFLEATDACPNGAESTHFDPIIELEPLAQAFQLKGASPNPFGGQTTLSFALPDRADVRLSVYDVMGRRVATLVDGTKSPGIHEVNWNGQADDGRRLASGLYLVRLQAGDRTATRRVSLVR